MGIKYKYINYKFLPTKKCTYNGTYLNLEVKIIFYLKTMGYVFLFIYQL